jgi:hypothetical protein
MKDIPPVSPRAEQHLIAHPFHQSVRGDRGAVHDAVHHLTTSRWIAMNGSTVSIACGYPHSQPGYHDAVNTARLHWASRRDAARKTPSPAGGNWRGYFHPLWSISG